MSESDDDKQQGSKRSQSTKTSKSQPEKSSSKSQAETTQKDRRGFASMDKEKQRQIASKGGKASGGNFKNNPARASAAGKKGGSK